MGWPGPVYAHLLAGGFPSTAAGAGGMTTGPRERGSVKRRSGQLIHEGNGRYQGDVGGHGLWDDGPRRVHWRWDVERGEIVWGRQRRGGGGQPERHPGERRRCTRKRSPGHANAGALLDDGSDANGPTAANGNDDPPPPLL